MRPSVVMNTYRAEISSIIEAHHATNARVFGSVATATDVEGSDLDILIDPTPETTLFDIGTIRYKLRQLLGVPVDVLTPNALPEHSRNLIISQATQI